MANFYVDLSAGSAGTGTFASPWNRLPLISGVTYGADKVWVRRATFVDTVVHINWIPPSGVPVIGWPISTDEDYATRPAAAQAAWDGDAGVYATVDMTNATQNANADATLVSITTGIAVTLKRLKLIYRVMPNISRLNGFTHSCVTITTTAPTIDFYNCVFQFLPVGTFALPSSYNFPMGPLVFGRGNSEVSGAINLSARYSTFEYGINNGGDGVSACIAGYRSTSSTSYLECIPGFSNSIIRLSTQASNEQWIASADTANRFAGNFYQCTFDNTLVRSGAVDMLQGQTSTNLLESYPRPLFVECAFNTVVSQAGRNGLALTTGRFIRCTAVNFQRLYIGVTAQAHFLSFLQGAPETVYPAAVETVVAGQSVVIDYLSLQLGNSRDISAHTELQAQVIVRNIAEGTGGYGPVSGNSRIVLANINNLVGTWKMIAAEGSVEASPNSRVGGEAFSLLMKPSPGGAPHASAALLVGLRSAWPGEDTTFVSLAAGSRTVTVFGYFGGYTTVPTKATVWVVVEYPTSLGFVSVTTRATGAVTTDASSWNVFSGGTVFKMVATFSVPADCVGAVRVVTTAFDSGAAYIALDPKPVVV